MKNWIRWSIGAVAALALMVSGWLWVSGVSPVSEADARRVSGEPTGLDRGKRAVAEHVVTSPAPLVTFAGSPASGANTGSVANAAPGAAVSWTDGWKSAAGLRTIPGVAGAQVKLIRADSERLELVYAFPRLTVRRVSLSALAAIAKAADPAGAAEQLADLALLVGELTPVEVALGNLPVSGGAGKPILPVMPTKHLVPAGRQVNRVEVALGNRVTLDGQYFVLPGQKPIPTIPDAKAEYTPPDEEIYGDDAVYPAERQGPTTVQRRRGVSYALVNLNPVEYEPESGRLSYYETMTVTVTTRPAGSGRGGAPEIRYRPDPVRPLDEGVDNPETISTYVEATVSVGGAAPLAGLPADNYQYLVITSEALKGAPSDPANGIYNFQDLLDWKAGQGMSVALVTVEQIYNNYFGADQAAQIREFVRDAYNNHGTDFVLLAGDADGADFGGETEPPVVPVRILDCSNLYMDGNIASDLYYQGLDGDWDYSGDGAYGQAGDGPGGGEVDTAAEVYVGRAPVSSAAQVSTFVEKTMRYAGLANASFATNALMVGEHLGFGGVSDEATGMMEEIRTGGTFHGVTCAGLQGSFKVDTLYTPPDWPRSAIIARINANKYNMIHHMGHCANYILMEMRSLNDVWPGNYNWDGDDVPLLTNGMPVFIYSQGCFPGAFDNWFYGDHAYDNHDCIAEKMLVGTASGMAAGVLNSRYGWGMGASTDGPSQWFHREFVDALLGSGVAGLGAANAESHEVNTWRLALADGNEGYARWCLYTSNLFGDPQLGMNGLPAQFRLAFSGVSVDDAIGAQNGDRVLSPGEEAGLTVTLVNAGNLAVTGGNGTLSTADGYVTVTDGQAVFGAIAPNGGRAAALDPFGIRVASNCPTPHVVAFNLAVTNSGGQSWSIPFTVTVYTTYSISGQVDLDGVPAADVQITCQGPAVLRAVTGADGRYVCAAVEGTNTVWAGKPAWGSSEPVQVMVPPDATNVDFHFSTALISGTVTVDGSPLEGATLTFEQPNDNWSTELVCSGDSIQSVKAGSVTEKALALVKGRWVEIRIEIDLDADRQTIYYDGQKLIEKSWTGGVSGGGRRNIAALDFWAANAPTNATGRAYYDGLSLAPEGLPSPSWVDDFESYTAGSNLHGQGGWQGWHRDPTKGAVVSTDYAQEGTQSARIEGASDVAHVFEGYTTGRWTLTVWQYLPTTYAPTSSQWLILMNDYNQGLGLGGTTLTGPDGRYAMMRIVPAGDPVAAWVTASAPDTLPADPTWVSVPPSRTNVNFAFTRGTVSGRVTLDGQPLEGAVLKYSGSFSGSVLSGPDGSYSITKLWGKPGQLTLTAGKDDYVESDSVTVTMPPSTGSVDFAFTTTAVSGRVTLDGEPLAGATLKYRGERFGSVRSEADGTYAIPAAVYGRPVKMSVAVERQGCYAPAMKLILPPGRTDADIALTTATLSGTVVDEATGAPVPGATVVYGGVLGGGVACDTNGAYAISAVFGAPGTLRVQARVAGDCEYWTSSNAFVTLPPSSSMVLRLALDPGPFYHVTAVTGLSGTALRVNDRGEVLGLSGGRSALWRSGAVTNVGDPPGWGVSTSAGIALSDNSQVLGTVTGSETWSPFVWSNGVWRLLAIPAEASVKSMGTPVTYNVYPQGINSAGAVAGYYGAWMDAAPFAATYRGVIWRADSTTEVLPDENGQRQTLAMSKLTTGYDLNDAGHIVQGWKTSSGSGLFIWDDGWVVSDLVDRSYGFSYVAINEFDECAASAGYIGDSTLWDHGLGATVARLNDSGDVVGYGTVGGSKQGFVWKNGRTFLLRDSVMNRAGWTFSEARDINNAGWIVGSGTLNGTSAVFLLTPTNPPAPADLVVAPPAVSASGYIEPGDSVAANLSISNAGARLLEWRLTLGAATSAGTLLRDLAPPDSVAAQSSGCTYDGRALWLSHASSRGGVLNKMDPVSGAIVGSLDISLFCSSPADLGWDGTNLWVLSESPRQILCVDPATGARIRTLPFPVSSSSMYCSMTWGDGALWVVTSSWVTGGSTSFWRTDKIYKLDPVTGATLRILDIPLNVTPGTQSVSGIACANGYIFLIWSGGGWVYRLDAVSGLCMERFSVPDNCVGALAHDGAGNFWVPRSGSNYSLVAGEVYSERWLRANLPEWTKTPSGTRTDVGLVLDPRAAGVGTHTGTMTIMSNDPDTPKLEVPVTFTVMERPAGFPLIARDPVPTLAFVGDTATFTVVATGAAPLAYQWRKNGTNIAGAVSASYTTAPTTMNDSGAAFSVAVSNAVGAAESRAAQLTVVDLDASMRLWLKLDEKSGTIAANSAGGTSKGWLRDSVAWSTGKIGGAALFPHSESVINISAPMTLSSGWSISAWFTAPLPNTGAPHVLAGCLDPEDAPLCTDTELNLGFHSWADGFKGCGFNLGSLTPGWHHVALVGRRYYIDGVYVGTANGVWSIWGLDGIGNHYWTRKQRFAEKVDDVRIYKKALTDAEVARLAAKAGTVPPVALASSGSAREGHPAVMTMAALDANGGTLTYSIVTQPGAGSLTGLFSNRVTYTPADGFIGTDSFTFRVNDATSASAPAPFTVLVRPLPRIERVARLDAGLVWLSWADADDGVYVDYSPTLVPTAQWQTAIGPLNGVTSLALPIPTNAPQGFFRIRAP